MNGTNEIMPASGLLQSFNGTALAPPLTENQKQIERAKPIYRQSGPTEASQGLERTEDSPAYGRPEAVAIVDEVNGTVIGFDSEVVSVRLANDICVEFPRVLFGDDTLVERGMPLKYQIKRREDGTRYQAFVVGSPQGLPEHVAALSAILDFI